LLASDNKVRKTHETHKLTTQLIRPLLSSRLATVYNRANYRLPRLKRPLNKQGSFDDWAACRAWLSRDNWPVVTWLTHTIVISHRSSANQKLISLRRCPESHDRSSDDDIQHTSTSTIIMSGCWIFLHLLSLTVWCWWSQATVGLRVLSVFELPGGG